MVWRSSWMKSCWVRWQGSSRDQPDGYPMVDPWMEYIYISGQISSRPHTTDFPQMVVFCRGNFYKSGNISVFVKYDNLAIYNCTYIYPICFYHKYHPQHVVLNIYRIRRNPILFVYVMKMSAVSKLWQPLEGPTEWIFEGQAVATNFVNNFLAQDSFQKFFPDLKVTRWWLCPRFFGIFTPDLGKWSNLTVAYFSNGLVQPPTRWGTFYNAFVGVILFELFLLFEMGPLNRKQCQQIKKLFRWIYVECSSMLFVFSPP